MQQLKSGSLLQGGKYRIEKVLGQGGFGITYLATQELLDRKVCIKEFFFKDSCSRNAGGEVTLGTIGNRDLVERFLNKFIKEARTLSQLDHPNIIRILDIFKENGTAYYVMDYIEGNSLEDIVNSRGALSESEAITYIKQVANALDYIHQRSINHLDVKPANIMVRRSDNKAILIDFGVSKQYDSTGEQTSTTPVGISYGYAPIEQYRPGGVSEFSPQADIYSLGATLYKLMTGEIPPLAMEILNDGLPNSINRFSSQIKEAIKSSMQIRKQDRPNSVNCFVSYFINNIKTSASLSYKGYSDDSAKKAQMYFDKARSIAKTGDSFPFYLKAAELGHVEAQIRVGVFYQCGVGIEEDEEKAFEWYKKAAKSEDADALNNLADCYNKGIGTKTDKLKAFEIYNKAFNIYLNDAENGNEDAMEMVAYYYKNGLGVSEAPQKVFEWTKKIVDSKSVTNQLLAKLAFYYEIGYGTEVDINKSKELYAKIVKTSDAKELYNIGTYFACKDDKKEKEQAHKWFSLAAEKGDVEVIKKIALYYECGVGIEENIQNAIKFYEKASKQGDVKAMVSLGYIYYKETEYQNYAKAIQWLQKVLEPENSDDLRSVDCTNEKEILEAIAFMYRYGGYGVVKNQSEALKWESRAKELSNTNQKAFSFSASKSIVSESMVQTSSITNSCKERFVKIVVDVLGVEPKDVIEKASIRNDLGADSLDAMDIIMRVEGEFGILINEDDEFDDITVGDAISFLEKAMLKKDNCPLSIKEFLNNINAFKTNQKESSKSLVNEITKFIKPTKPKNEINNVKEQTNFIMKIFRYMQQKKNE